jgi:hypothetical protein
MIARYEDDPARFSREVLSFEPWSRQREVLEAVKDHERVVVRAGNAVGKSSSASVASCWWLSRGPGHVVVMTSNTEAQVRRVLWREFARRVRSARGWFGDARLGEMEFRLAADWWAVALTAESPDALQGVHAAGGVLVVIDEASGSPDWVLEAAESMLAGGDGRLLALGNPLRPSGWFYRAHTSERAAWHQVAIPCTSAPCVTGEVVSVGAARGLVSRRWIDAARDRWGESSPLWESRVLGRFPSRADDTVCALGEVEAAGLRVVAPSAPCVVGVDVARFGSDLSVIAVRRGMHVRVVEAYSGADTMATVGRVVRVVRALEAEGYSPVVVPDDVGVGSGVSDRLREQGYRVRPFVASAAARSPRDYPNARSEAWFRMADALPLLDLDPLDAALAADLVAPTYSITSQGQRVVERKVETRRRLRRSPDRADAVILSLTVSPPVGRRRSRARVYSAASVQLAGERVDGALSGRLAGLGAPDGEGAAARRRARLVVPGDASESVAGPVRLPRLVRGPRGMMVHVHDGDGDEAG